MNISNTGFGFTSSDAWYSIELNSIDMMYDVAFQSLPRMETPNKDPPPLQTEVCLVHFALFALVVLCVDHLNLIMWCHHLWWLKVDGWWPLASGEWREDREEWGDELAQPIQRSALHIYHSTIKEHQHKGHKELQLQQSRHEAISTIV